MRVQCLTFYTTTLFSAIEDLIIQKILSIISDKPLFYSYLVAFLQPCVIRLCWNLILATSAHSKKHFYVLNPQKFFVFLLSFWDCLVQWSDN